MSRPKPPEHRGPEAVAGLRERQERATPIRREPPAEPGGISALRLNEEVERLQGMDRAALLKEAYVLEMHVSAKGIVILDWRETDALRFLILERKLAEALGGDEEGDAG